MATSVSSIPILAPAVGRSSMFLKRAFQELRRVPEREFRLRTASHGGGRGAVHFTLELGTILIATSAPTPKEVPDWARGLSGIRCVRERVEKPVGGAVETYTRQNGPGTAERLRDYLNRQAEGLADPRVRAEAVERYGPSWSMRLSINPAYCVIEWTEPDDGSRRILEFEPDQPELIATAPSPTPPPHSPRILGFDALAALGRCWEDSLQHRAMRTLGPDRERGVRNDSAGSEAPDPARHARSNHRSRNGETLEQPHHAADRRGGQSLSSARVGHTKGTDPPCTATAPA